MKKGFLSFLYYKVAFFVFLVLFISANSFLYENIGYSAQTKQAKEKSERQIKMQQAREVQALTTVTEEPTFVPTKEKETKKEPEHKLSFDSLNLAVDGQYATPMAPVKQYNTFYLQYLDGDVGNQVRSELLKLLRNEYKLNVVEVLPASLEKVAVIRLHVQDFSIWETKEKIKINLMHVKDKERWPSFIIRRNVLIRFQIEIYNAKERTLDSRTTYIRPFQQVYVQRTQETKIVSKKNELLRLSLLLMKNMITSELFHISTKKNYSYAPVSFFATDRRLNRAMSLLNSGFASEAVWLWQLILYTPLQGEDSEDYLKAKRDAFYNLGIYLSKKNQWKVAIYMFAQANRLDPQVVYADLWGQATYQWLYQQKLAQVLAQEQAAKEKGTTKKETKSTTTSKVIAKPKRKYKAIVPKLLPIPDNVLLLESLPSLLLQPKKLWTTEDTILKSDFDTYVPDLLKTAKPKEKVDFGVDNTKTIDTLQK